MKTKLRQASSRLDRAEPVPAAKVAPEEAIRQSWVPVAQVSLLQGLGLLLLATAYAASRAGNEWATTLHWLALALLFVPVALRQFSPSTSRQERLILLGMLAMSLFAVKVLYSPLQYKFSDELQHWRTAQNILDSHRLFSPNYILPVSPIYPGLEIIAAAVVELTGLSIFQAGLAVMAVARLLLVLALFLVFERAGASIQVAGVATLLYMTHPHFLFLNAMFTYQALALTFAALVILSAAHCSTGHGRTRLAWRIVFVLVLIGLAATHHVTMYIVAGFLVLWAIAGWFLRAPRSQTNSEIVSAVLAVVAALGWLLLVAPETKAYLSNALRQPLNLQAIFAAGRTGEVPYVFRPPSGPLADKLISVTATAIMLLGLGLGWSHLWRRRRSHNSLAAALAVAAVGYVAGLVWRVMSNSGELTGRVLTFVFVPAALVWAVGIIHTRLPQWLTRAWSREAWIRWAAPALALAMFLGGLTSGWPPYWGRVPGPYLPGAAERSVTPEGVAAASWVGAGLMPGNRFATDFTDYMLVGAYGHQYPVFGLSDVFTASVFTGTELHELKQQQIRYLLVDRRLASGPPRQGYYFDPWEKRADEGASALDVTKLFKFDDVPEISRVFDSGNIVIYDVGELTGVR